MTVATREDSLTLEQMLARMFPEPHGLLRLTVHGFNTHDFFFKSYGTRWHWPPGSPAGAADEPSAVLARTEPDVPVTLNPLLYAAASPGARAMLPVLWVALDVARGPSTTGYGERIDAISARSVITSARALRPALTLIVDEGRRVVGIFTLTRPLRDLDEAARVLTALAVKHGGDRRACDPRQETFALPGQRQAGVFPTQHVTAHLLHDQAVELAQLI